MYSIMKIHLGRGAICPAGAAPPDEQSLSFSFFRKGGLALAKRTAGKPRVMEVDIHGMTEEQAKKRLETLLSRADPSLEELVVIHGYHNGHALRDMVQHRLRHRRIAAKLISLNPGATRLLLKKEV